MTRQARRRAPGRSLAALLLWLTALCRLAKCHGNVPLAGLWKQLWEDDQQDTHDHPLARSGHSAVISHDTMAVFGGFAGRSDTDFLSDLWTLNLNTSVPRTANAPLITAPTDAGAHATCPTVHCAGEVGRPTDARVLACGRARGLATLPSWPALRLLQCPCSRALAPPADTQRWGAWRACRPTGRTPLSRRTHAPLR